MLDRERVPHGVVPLAVDVKCQSLVVHARQKPGPRGLVKVHALDKVLTERVPPVVTLECMTVKESSRLRVSANAQRADMLNV